MDIQLLNEIDIDILKQLISVSEELRGIKKQKSIHDISVKEIHELIKEYKANRNKKLQILVGGNIIIEKSNRDAIKIFQDRGRQIDIALKGIIGQIEHREDVLREMYNKIYNMAKTRMGD